VIGQMIKGTYQLLKLVASGGFGDIYLAHDVRANTVVAIKTLHPHLARDPSIVERFRREAQTARALNDARVVRVLDEGEEQGIPFLVMEYVQGLTLAHIVREQGPLPVPVAVEYVSQVLQALEHAHQLGIVHRDIKPLNIMVTEERQVKVMDFGIAKMVLAESVARSGASIVAGTPRYMSPEQIRGEAVDARSDLYSVAVTLFELLTGKPPFSGETSQVLYEQVNVPPPSLAQLRPDIPPALSQVLDRGLAKDPARRFSTARLTRRASVAVPASV